MRMSSEEEKQFSDLLEKYIAICTDYLSKDNGSEFPGQVYKRKKINEQISYKKLRLLESAKHYITERRTPLLIGASPDVPAEVSL